MLEFGWESCEELLDDGILELSRRHWDEIALDKEDVPLDIDIDRYLHMERTGYLRVFGARRDGKLVGYVMWYFDRPARYRSTLHISDHIFWLMPEERRGATGYFFLKAALAALPRPSKVQVREKLSFHNGGVGLILGRLGMKPIEMVHSILLKDD